mmetsp:Transcript_50323/g.150349  ORF Transcript_50323/g.150349 Transcript_50323/m.150349 type:complete len:264 (-) Transcript_50323:96-887(-)
MASVGEKFKIFVGSLPPDCTTEDLMIVFGTYGTPIDIHLMAGKSNSGQSCAFVVYDTREAAENAIASLDGVYNMREDGNEPVRVSWARGGAGGGAAGRPKAMQAPAPVMHAPAMQPRYAQPAVDKLVAGAPQGGMGGAIQPVMHMRPGEDPYGGCGGIPAPPPPDPGMARPKTKLFVGNLPADITQEAIATVFGHYGAVTNIHVMVGKSRSGQACAFVEYAAALEAETAVLTLHEKYEIRPGDGPILVKFANSAGMGARASPY